MPHLIVAGKKIALNFDFSGAVTIGRHISNSLPLPDPEVSRHHVQIFPRDEAFVIADLGSHNGMLVNGKRVTEQTLAPNDEVILGTTLLFFDPPSVDECEGHLSRQGRRVWQSLPETTPEHFEPAGVSAFSHVELDKLILNWLDRKDASVLIPYKLRSDFLRFMLSLDGAATRGELCGIALQFLQRRVGAQRSLVLAPDNTKKKLDILASEFAPEIEPDGRDFQVPKDILRIVLDAEKAVFSPNCADDFRFKHLIRKSEIYPMRSFLAAPIFAGGEFSAFLYLDQPAGGPKYDFKCLAQAYLTGAILGKCLHWHAVGRAKKGKQ